MHIILTLDHNYFCRSNWMTAKVIIFCCWIEGCVITSLSRFSLPSERTSSRSLPFTNPVCHSQTRIFEVLNMIDRPTFGSSLPSSCSWLFSLLFDCNTLILMRESGQEWRCSFPSSVLSRNYHEKNAENCMQFQMPWHDFSFMAFSRVFSLSLFLSHPCLFSTQIRTKKKNETGSETKEEGIIEADWKCRRIIKRYRKKNKPGSMLKEGCGWHEERSEFSGCKLNDAWAPFVFL